MKSTLSNNVESELVQVMTTCLRLMLDDLRAQYRRLGIEAKRLEEAGGEARYLYEQLQQLQIVGHGKHGEANTDRRVRRSRVRS